MLGLVDLLCIQSIILVEIEALYMRLPFRYSSVQHPLNFEGTVELGVPSANLQELLEVTIGTYNLVPFSQDIFRHSFRVQQI